MNKKFLSGNILEIKKPTLFFGIHGSQFICKKKLLIVDEYSRPFLMKKDMIPSYIRSYYMSASKVSYVYKVFIDNNVYYISKENLEDNVCLL